MNHPDDSNALHVHDQLLAGLATLHGMLTRLQTSEGTAAEEIHAIRKFTKSLRGGFSLLDHGKRAAKEIQAIARLLSGSRDAVSRRNTWEKLAWNDEPTAAAAIQAWLATKVRIADFRPSPDVIAWCHARLANAQRQLEDLPQDELPERMSRGQAHLRHQVRKCCNALAHGKPKDFHELRKALKAYLGSMEFLPEATVPADPIFSDLAEMLGDENDLTTMAEWLNGHGFTKALVPDLWKHLRKIHRKVRKQAAQDAAALLATKTW